MFYNFMVEKLNFRMRWTAKELKFFFLFYGQNFLLISASWKICFNMRWDVSWVLTFDAKKSFYSRSAYSEAALQQQSQIIHGSPLGPTSKPKDAHKALFHYLLPFKLKNNPFLKTKNECSWKLSFWTRIVHLAQCVGKLSYDKSKVNFVKPKENLSLLFCCHPNCPGIEFWVSRVIRADTYHAFQASCSS